MMLDLLLLVFCETLCGMRTKILTGGLLYLSFEAAQPLIDDCRLNPEKVIRVYFYDEKLGMRHGFMATPDIAEDDN